MSDIDALEAQGRLQEAAEQARLQGLHARASTLFERACLFAPASVAALDAGDARRALLLASLCSDDSVAEPCIDALVADPEHARTTAELLRAKGRDRHAALLLERLGDLQNAAGAWARAGEPGRAAAAWEASGDAREAARVLEAALRLDGSREDLILALGSLLVRAGRHEPAARILQRVAPDSPLRPKVLPLLASCFDALGLAGPRAELDDEARKAGVELASVQGPVADDAPHGVIYGRYEVVRTAASTPSARVLEAVDRLTHQRVAIKQLLGASLVGAGRDAFGRLVREARILQQLRHPNVLPLVELVEDAGAIITPWMPGGSLADRIAHDPIAPARAIEIACAVLGALAEAHRLGILHRDIKPSNVLFDGAGVTMLADFGAAHISDSSTTATAGVIGTLAYMSPEQRAGRPATPASDIFGVGATLLEMLTGQPPAMSGDRPIAPSKSNPDLTPAHDQALLAMIEEDPSRRPQGSLAARDALASLPWPSKLPGAAWQRDVAELPRSSSASRLKPVHGARFLDDWLQRRVIVVPMDEPMQRIARGYVAASCDCLPAVVRADTEAGQLWFEEPEGVPLSQAQRRLSADELDSLQRAMDRLHQQAVAHGALDAEHVFVVDDPARGSMVLVAFEPATAATATPEMDREAIASLRSRFG
ncbi:MAG: protein kinase [Deltaproteobacteria bacterium]|nr:protein kinase [Deltaproteobacteria bacterium]